MDNTRWDEKQVIAKNVTKSKSQGNRKAYGRRRGWVEVGEGKGGSDLFVYLIRSFLVHLAAAEEGYNSEDIKLRVLS